MSAFRQSRADAGSAACAARRGRHRRVRTKKPWIAARSSISEAPRRPENPGVESPQQKGDSPMELVTPSPLGPYAALDRLGDEIAELSAHLEAATAPLLDLIREFDARGGWNTGFRSCAAWLSWRVGLAPGAARERVRVAHALHGLPRTDEAMRIGQVSYSKVRAMTRVATADNEAALVEMARSATAAQIEKICRGVRCVDRHGEAR